SAAAGRARASMCGRGARGRGVGGSRGAVSCGALGDEPTALPGYSRPAAGRRVRYANDAGMPDSSTILLVDDEDSIQTLLTYPLERERSRVLQARDGEDALRLFQSEHVDLVVLDLMLPKLDGLEVCKRLRAESQVPIIMLTARDDELDKVLGLELGAEHYMTK